MPREDDVVILGKPTLKLLGIDVSDSLGARARERAGLTVVDTAAYRQCRRVTVRCRRFAAATELNEGGAG